jgi:outer membrane protein
MRIVMIVFLAFLSAGTFAQTTDQKFGYANFESIFTQMPDSKQIENALKIHGDQLKAQLDAKYKEYQSKVTIYKGLPATTPDAIRADKEAELTQLQQNIQKFQQDAQESLQKKQNDLMEPVFAKIGKAIEAVAKENGFTYIFTAKSLTGDNVILYADEKYNVSTLVLKKLGVTIPVAAATK